MYRIAKEFSFEAAHSLSGLGDTFHPCARVHGHTYRVIITFESATLNMTGMVQDFKTMDRIKAWLDSNYDHRLLNDTIPQPTAEHISERVYTRCRDLYGAIVKSVRVWETQSCWAEYEGDSE